MLKYENTSGTGSHLESEDGFVFKRDLLSDRFGVINDLLEKSCPGYLSMYSYEASDLFVGDKKRDRARRKSSAGKFFHVSFCRSGKD